MDQTLSPALISICPALCLEPCFNDVYERVRFSRRPYSTVKTEGPDQCREKCLQDQQCYFYTFRNKSLNCELKFTMPIPTPNFKPMDNAFSGFSNNVDVDFLSVCPSQLYPDRQLEGGSYHIQFSAFSAEHCQALCNIYPQCHVFMYFRDSKEDLKNCHMRSDSGSEKKVTERQGVTSGKAQKGCKVDFSA